VQHSGPGNNFTSGPLDIYIHPVEQEVVFTTVEFGMTDDALEQISGWQEFAEQLCSKWGFSLTEGVHRMPIAQFHRILAQDRNWRLISDSKGWPPIWTSTE
jgi:hypothetical protein